MNFKQIDETSSKCEFPLIMLSTALTDSTGTPKEAAFGINKQCHAGCLISVVIIWMILIDPVLSPTAAGPGETFDPFSLKRACPWEVSLSTCHLGPRGGIRNLRQQRLSVFIPSGEPMFAVTCQSH